MLRLKYPQGYETAPEHDRLIEAYPAMNAEQLANAMADGLAAASLVGRYDVLRGL